jgi:hypothetical protein
MCLLLCNNKNINYVSIKINNLCYALKSLAVISCHLEGFNAQITKVKFVFVLEGLFIFRLTNL